ncbi:MAG: nucleotidyl transferase AbiEii/AbiGii toxin family protein [Burkholderiaceae bacterium]|nr:nucleotidyl transferase AbiEii/AbiGii toxin family protein [Burkholderiaceae bacterium]
MSQRNIGASVRARLLEKARTENVNFIFLLTRFAMERLLYRLSISEEKDHFLLKGALLFDLWYDVPLRPTRDIDLLGFGLAEIPHLIQAFKGICVIECDDGIVFNTNAIKAEEIRKEANYSGIRLTIPVTLDHARCQIQVDVGYGDPVTPAPETAIYPVMLAEMPAPVLRVYPRYTVVAEKLEAIVSLGIANSRMKDYFDLWVILRDEPLDRETLALAFSKTLERRKTLRPATLPIGLSERFVNDSQKQKQWKSFIDRNKLSAQSLDETVRVLVESLSFLFQER